MCGFRFLGETFREGRGFADCKISLDPDVNEKTAPYSERFCFVVGLEGHDPPTFGL